VVAFESHTTKSPPLKKGDSGGFAYADGANTRFAPTGCSPSFLFKEGVGGWLLLNLTPQKKSPFKKGGFRGICP